MDNNEVMSGKIYCGTHKATVIIGFVWYAAAIMVGAVFGLKSLWVMVPLLFIALTLTGADNVRYYADEDGVVFRRGITKKYIAYEDIVNVTIVPKPCGHARFGGTLYENELTIKLSDSELIIRESCGVLYAEDIIEHPADVEMQLHENELSWLAEYIQERI